jgi:hypothetical protein
MPTIIPPLEFTIYRTRGEYANHYTTARIHDLPYSRVLHVHCHLCFMFHYTQSSTSCTLSPLFYVSLHRADNIHEVQFCSEILKRGDNVHEVQLCVMKYKAVLHVHCHLFYISLQTELYFMYIVTSFLCFTTHSCTACTLSPLFYVSLHKKEVTMYMKYSSVCSEI